MLSAPPSDMESHPKTEIQVHDREDSDFINEVIMAIDVKNACTMVGCCYYIARSETLLLSSDIQSDSLADVDACVYCPKEIQGGFLLIIASQILHTANISYYLYECRRKCRNIL